MEGGTIFAIVWYCLCALVAVCIGLCVYGSYIRMLPVHICKCYMNKVSFVQKQKVLS